MERNALRWKTFVKMRLMSIQMYDLKSINISFLLFSFSDIYWKHGPKHNCWEPTADTSNCPVRSPVSLDLALGPVYADGSSGMRSCLDVVCASHFEGSYVNDRSLFTMTSPFFNSFK